MNREVEVVTVINAGESFASLHFTYRMGKSTVGEIIYDTMSSNSFYSSARILTGKIQSTAYRH